MCALKKGELVEASGQRGKGMHQGRWSFRSPDPDDVLLAYAGRWAGADDAIPEGQGKYLLPKAEQFRKSLEVYNLARATAHAGAKRIVIVCEEYFSAVRLWEHGFRCCVALMGCSISERRYAAGNSPDALALGDLDGDGTLELAIANYDDSTVSVLPDR